MKVVHRICFDHGRMLGTTLLQKALDQIRKHIENHQEEYGDDAVEFHPSVLRDFEEQWAQLDAAFPDGPQNAMKPFYELCDGFADGRHTALFDVASFLAQANSTLATNRYATGLYQIIWVGNGLGLDERAIYLLEARWFETGEPHFVFSDYDLGVAPPDFISRVKPEFRDIFQVTFPIPSKDGNDSGFFDYGPCSLVELLEYIHKTATMI